MDLAAALGNTSNGGAGASSDSASPQSAKAVQYLSRSQPLPIADTTKQSEFGGGGDTAAGGGGGGGSGPAPDMQAIGDAFHALAPLPAGWVRARSEADGRFYFFDSNSNPTHTQWQHPHWPQFARLPHNTQIDQLTVMEQLSHTQQNQIPIPVAPAPPQLHPLRLPLSTRVMGGGGGGERTIQTRFVPLSHTTGSQSARTATARTATATGSRGGWNNDVTLDRSGAPARLTEISLPRTHITTYRKPTTGHHSHSHASRSERRSDHSLAATGNGNAVFTPLNPYYAHTTSYAQTHNFLFDESTSRPLHPAGLTSAVIAGGFDTSLGGSGSGGARTKAAVHLHTSLPTHNVNEAIRVKLAKTQAMKFELEKKLSFVTLILSKLAVCDSDLGKFVNRIRSYIVTCTQRMQLRDLARKNFERYGRTGAGGSAQFDPTQYIPDPNEDERAFTDPESESKTAAATFKLKARSLAAEEAAAGGDDPSGSGSGGGGESKRPYRPPTQAAAEDDCDLALDDEYVALLQSDKKLQNYVLFANQLAHYFEEIRARLQRQLTDTNTVIALDKQSLALNTKPTVDPKLFNRSSDDFNNSSKSNSPPPPLPPHSQFGATTYSIASDARPSTTGTTGSRRSRSSRAHTRARLEALDQSLATSKPKFHYNFKSSSLDDPTATFASSGGDLSLTGASGTGSSTGGGGGNQHNHSIHIQQLFAHIETVGAMAIQFTHKTLAYLSRGDPTKLAGLNKRSQMAVRSCQLHARELKQQIERDLQANQHRIELVQTRRREVNAAHAAQLIPLNVAQRRYELRLASPDLVNDSVKPQLEAELQHLQARIAALDAQLNAIDDELKILWGVNDELNAQLTYQHHSFVLYSHALKAATAAAAPSASAPPAATAESNQPHPPSADHRNSGSRTGRGSGGGGGGSSRTFRGSRKAATANGNNN